MERKRLGVAVVLSCLFVLSMGAGPAAPREPADWVNPYIDSANSRWFFFGGACRPFGLIKLHPDMLESGDWGTGYRYNVPTIRGFSHLHCWQLGGIPVMPMVGAMRGPAGPAAYAARYSHERETARPGYYAVTLDDAKIKVELTATTRVGFHRYTFPAGDRNFLVLDLGREWGPSAMSSFTVRRTGPDSLAGMVVQAPSRRRPKDVPTFFVIQFDRPFAEFAGWGPGATTDQVTGGNGKGGVFVRFGGDQSVLMKVAVSYCDEAGAQNNLSELTGWEFDRVAEEAGADWNAWLGRVRVSGGTDKLRTRFYTDLWHALLGRSIWSDLDGRYSDYTGPSRRVRQIPAGPDGKPRYDAHNSDAFWGAQWGISLLWSLAYPKTMSSFVNSMVDMYKDGGLIPRGPAGGNYTYVMTGASSTPFIVAAYLKGIRDFDVNTAYEGMVKNHLPGGMMSKAGYEFYTNKGGGIEYYIERGYIPDRRYVKGAFHVDGAGQTLEYAYQDWALAQMATALGHKDDATRFTARADNYKNLFDQRAGWMRPRTLLGTWMWPWEPEYYLGWIGFVESNAAQSTWYVPHDIGGLIGLMGGPEEFSRRLDDSFRRAEPMGFVKQKGRVFYRGPINYGNQPDMHVAWLFHYAGKPWLSEQWVRRVKDTVYGSTDPQAGYHGDEDQGLMGSLSALMAIGLFDVQGGCGPEPVWLLTAPEFDRVEIDLDQAYYPGGKFTIATKNQGPGNIHIQRAWLNGTELSRAYIYHKDIAAGGELVLELGPQPNKNWGARPEDWPASMSNPAP